MAARKKNNFQSVEARSQDIEAQSQAFPGQAFSGEVRDEGKRGSGSDEG